MVVKVQGEFVWHKHNDTDDFFLVLEGRLIIRLRDRNVVLGSGELYVVPRGIGLTCASVSPGAESFLSHFAATLLERPLKPPLCTQLSAENSWQILRNLYLIHGKADWKRFITS